jgi:excisionase family DNA binding protein
MVAEAIRTNPLALTMHEAVRVSGLSRSELYRRLADGKVRAVKSGSRMLILMDSLQTHLSSLPPATFRHPHVGAPVECRKVKGIENVQ